MGNRKIGSESLTNAADIQELYRYCHPFGHAARGGGGYRERVKQNPKDPLSHYLLGRSALSLMQPRAPTIRPSH